LLPTVLVEHIPISKMETIVAAAIIKPGDGIYLGRRHHEILNNARGRLKCCEQGFVTSTGRFVDRTEGARVALAAGQIKELRYQPDTLFSEELW
jgi:hypothetical protein